MDGKQPTHSEEIDLAYLFRPVGKLMRRISDRTARHFSALKANILIFIALFLLVSAVGYCLRFVIPHSYETEGIFATRFLPAKYCELLTDDLNSNVGDPLIADRLHLGVDVADNITKISLNPLTEPLDLRDTLLQSFILHIHLKKMDHLDSIQRSLLAYFENNDYALKRKEETTIALRALRQNLIGRINSLDSLTPIVNSSIIPRSTGQGIILGQPIDPVNVYKAQDSFFRQRVRIETELTNMDNIEIVQPFLKLNEPNYPKFGLITLCFIGGGLLLAFFLTPALGRKP
jgi:hypothetical protein